MRIFTIALIKSLNYNKSEVSIQLRTSEQRGGKLMTGKVKWFNAEKGYGFIDCGDGNDIFVHYTAIRMKGFKTLLEGSEVRFEIVQGAFGSHAINVIPL